MSFSTPIVYKGPYGRQVCASSVKPGPSMDARLAAVACHRSTSGPHGRRMCLLHRQWHAAADGLLGRRHPGASRPHCSNMPAAPRHGPPTWRPSIVPIGFSNAN